MLYNLIMKEENDIEGFPKEIVEKMLDYQEEQGNERDIEVFQHNKIADGVNKGFWWNETPEDFSFWTEVIYKLQFWRFFEKYPKQK
jgi:hypothetical protein